VHTVLDFVSIRSLGRRWRIPLCAALGMACGSLTAAVPAAPPPPGQDFSADIVTRDASGAVIGAGAKLFVANGKVRIETADTPDAYFLVDSEAGTAVFVRPERRIFMDAGRSTRLTQIFVPVNPGDPCKQWQEAARIAGVSSADGDWRCERVATAAPTHHAAFELRVISPQSESSHRWVDPDLRFPVKLQSADGTTIALEHIQAQAAQPASLFAVPSEFRKLDPQALIDRIKHSDVWAEAPPR
jgi:hypothetical protein